MFEIDEQMIINEDVKEYLKKLLLEARIDLDLLKDAARHLNWKKVEDLLVKPSQPTKTRKRLGDFGEILTNALLVEVYGYIVPVPKLRFAISSEQSQPGTDTIAIKRRNGFFSEICFVESKLRTADDNYSCRAGVEGYEQLKKDYLKRVPDMISFVLARLHDKQDPLFYDFLNYLSNRQDLTHIDRFRLGLTWEHGKWKETILEALEEEVDTSLPRLCVQRVRIQELASNVEDLFASMGVDIVEDE